MKVKFSKGVDKKRPEVWSSINLFSMIGKRDSRRKKLKLLVSTLKKHGIKSKIENFAPYRWTFEISAVCIDQDAANEAFFLLLAADGIEI